MIKTKEIFVLFLKKPYFNVVPSKLHCGISYRKYYILSVVYHLYEMFNLWSSPSLSLLSR